MDKNPSINSNIIFLGLKSPFPAHLEREIGIWRITYSNKLGEKTLLEFKSSDYTSEEFDFIKQLAVNLDADNFLLLEVLYDGRRKL